MASLSEPDVCVGITFWVLRVYYTLGETSYCPLIVSAQFFTAGKNQSWAWQPAPFPLTGPLSSGKTLGPDALQTECELQVNATEEQLILQLGLVAECDLRSQQIWARKVWLPADSWIFWIDTSKSITSSAKPRLLQWFLHEECPSAVLWIRPRRYRTDAGLEKPFWIAKSAICMRPGSVHIDVLI